MTPKENYLYMIKNNIPEFMPSNFEPFRAPCFDELLTPNRAPNGPIVTALGVKYVGSPENNYGATPAPGSAYIDDITEWRDKLKIRSVEGRDWESYYKKEAEKYDRSKVCLCVDGGDYFLTLVALMGFENTMMACYEEPDEVKALLTEISRFYTLVLTKQMEYLRPEIMILMDDDSAYRAPFFSVEMYREFFKPFHKLHADIALNYGCVIDRHDCGKSEQFIDDWLDIGVRGWNPCQISNDLVGIKKKYGDRLVLAGCWDSQGHLGSAEATEDELAAAMDEYVATFAPGGNFIFSANVGSVSQAPEAVAKRAFIKQYFMDHFRDYYKN